ncbi:TetR/AcrR family transcriptional regulator [Streptomyces hoynatensis]|uniref:TetR/AcrR family transcriptional regulator n=1 Tax=Streptomyces hoynatensis TaxID=1141874 RepID=A0A3A9Z404_9ACTN|nr:TetR family transcriptional regulator [Streptomyces hoynatensis]RKN42980.1 TetR/AcrR family transcriptional regulator [Streptomyces hoynatensis]
MSTTRSPYDAEATRRRIFEAAAAEFAAHGLAGARIDRIAARAEANKQAIYLYYGGKEKLFAAVVQVRIEELCRAARIDPEDPAASAERLFDAYAERPEVVRLVLWEALETRDGPAAGEEARRAEYRELIRSLCRDPGREREAQDWLQTLLSLVAWNFAAPQVTRMLLDEPTDEAALRRRRATVTALAAALPRPRRGHTP